MIPPNKNIVRWTQKNTFSDDLLFHDNLQSNLPQTHTRDSSWFFRNDLITIHNCAPYPADAILGQGITDAMLEALKGNYFTIKVKYHYKVRGLDAKVNNI